MNEAAPIVQLLLTIQFREPAHNLTVFDYADLRGVFHDYPIHQHIPRAGPMPVLQPALQFTTFTSEAPRLQFLTEDLQWAVLFQEDRLSVGWNRITDFDHAAGYPGFVAVFSRLLKEQGRLAEFLIQRGNEAPVPGVGEVAYTDTFQLKRQDGTQRRFDDLFCNVRSLEEFKFNMSNLTYTRIVKGDYPSHVETNINGPAAYPTGQVVASLRTTVRFAAEDDALEARFDHAHREAQDVFQTLVKPGAFAILEN